MYSETITPKVNQMFADLSGRADEIIAESESANEAINRIVQLIASETSSRSKSILSDMLFELNNTLFETPFFSDIARRNKFTEMNLRQEILNKYQFSVKKVDYQEASRAVQALKVGGAALAIGGIGEVGYALIKGLSLSSLVPIPVGVLVAAALGAAMVDYLAVEPHKNKSKFKQAVNGYLRETQNQFLLWFDEIEGYFDRRVEAFKQTS